jgi:hypothetical protein
MMANCGSGKEMSRNEAEDNSWVVVAAGFRLSEQLTSI